MIFLGLPIQHMTSPFREVTGRALFFISIFFLIGHLPINNSKEAARIGDQFKRGKLPLLALLLTLALDCVRCDVAAASRAVMPSYSSVSQRT